MRIAIIGAGHLGKIHIKCAQQIKDLEITGFFDINEKIRNEVSQSLGIRAFERLEACLESADIIDIVTPTFAHYSVAIKALEKGKHIFVEKPITQTSQEAKELQRLASEKNLKVQVGHVERFNPAFMAAEQLGDLQPMFIEGHRLAQFNPRGTDVSVILDLMIHDLDLVLALVKSPVRQVQANGVSVVSKSADICNARIEFENGCVANLTSSRISLKNMRKLRLFQTNAYIGIDMLDKELQVVRLFDKDPLSSGAMELQTNEGTKWIQIDQPTVTANNAIVEELKSFTEAVQMDRPPRVSALDASQSIELAESIDYQVKKSLGKIKK